MKPTIPVVHKIAENKVLAPGLPLHKGVPCAMSVSQDTVVIPLRTDVSYVRLMSSMVSLVTLTNRVQQKPVVSDMVSLALDLLRKVELVVAKSVHWANIVTMQALVNVRRLLLPLGTDARMQGTMERDVLRFNCVIIINTWWTLFV